MTSQRIPGAFVPRSSSQDKKKGIIMFSMSRQDVARQLLEDSLSRIFDVPALPGRQIYD